MKKIISIFAVACLMISCGSSSDKEAEQLRAQQKTVDSMKTEMVKAQTIDSMNAIAAQQASVNNEQSVAVSSRRSNLRSTGNSRPTTNNYTTNNNTTNAGNAPAPVATTEPKKKKGWSDKAKGAAIGTGVGAITGAMVDKKKGEGAVVGGLIGAAAGLGAGAILDNKNKNK